MSSRTFGLMVPAAVALTCATAVSAQPTPLERLQEDGTTLHLGAGAGNFVGDVSSNFVDTGLTWELRGAMGTNRILGWELAYVGSSQAVDETVDEDATLVGTGAEAALRLGAPFDASPEVDLRPFAFLGLGWQRYTFFGEGQRIEQTLQETDNVLAIPAGLGLEVGVGRLSVGARVTYRHTIGSEMFGDEGDLFLDERALHQWNAGGTIGVEL